ncbi:Predicted nucleotidyltransferase [Butyrivibrio fibrisolvens DSM 3071]|uniref:tRNA(Met) cytidine acetate ligase n=1 Tax=Butyrivibrio fibrisolvens DSM 3071 TaxID=1121131 RepID=A0A1M5T9I2_BUTFI|nr:nucleotidyltransferase [Butyrivibrio fibrisolvens]SHH47427.1 Predicted nucleotidyltransferase [Butyrivibrio fibrisolvens DSM 3071]
MKTIGIVCELNPLHSGHKYLLDMARQKFSADYVVLVMSGDYTQRGVPSIVSKEVRTRMALMAGADAVFELPVQYATASAEYFASGAVSLLNSLGCVDHILFGTENGDIEEIQKIASILNDEPDEYKKELQKGLKRGLNFASARDAALKKLITIGNSTTLIGSNNILGIEYCRALMASGSKITPLTIKREGSDYNEEELADNFSSASSIRKVLESGMERTKKDTTQNTNNELNSSVKASLEQNIPADILDLLLSQNKYNRLDNYSDYLHYKLLSERDNGFISYADIHRDLSDKIIKNLPKFTTISDFAQLLKSKDLTYTRIQRSLLHILLGITQETMDMLKENNYPTYIRLLGFKKDSSALLAQIKESAAAPVISRMSDSFRLEDELQKSLLAQDVLASDIYHLLMPEAKNEYQKPVVIL